MFPACERNTCRMQQVLDGGAKVGVIGIKVVSTLGGNAYYYPYAELAGSSDDELTEVLSSD